MADVDKLVRRARHRSASEGFRESGSGIRQVVLPSYRHLDEPVCDADRHLDRKFVREGPFGSFKASYLAPIVPQSRSGLAKATPAGCPVYCF